MQFSYETSRLILKVLPPEAAPMIRQFYQDNRTFLEPFEPLRPENFYTTEFHHANLLCEYNAFLRLSYFRYWLFSKDIPDKPLGSVCFSNILHGAFEHGMVGYKLGQHNCHNGYMYEALSLLIPLLCKELRLHRLEAYVQPDNTPSIRLLTKLGFVEEGYLQKYAEICGKWTDHLLFSYLAEP